MGWEEDLENVELEGRNITLVGWLGRIEQRIGIESHKWKTALGKVADQTIRYRGEIDALRREIAELKEAARTVKKIDKFYKDKERVEERQEEEWG